MSTQEGYRVAEYKVFLASPRDVERERQIVRDILQECNQTLTAMEARVRFTVIDYENYATAGVG